MSGPGETARVVISLSAVILSVDGGKPLVLAIRGAGGEDALPYGPFDPVEHRTFELGLRGWVERQTGLALDYVEQLYTFGDRGRRAPSARLDGGTEDDRIISVGYLALVRRPDAVAASDADWRDWHTYFPWEDWRAGQPAITCAILDHLSRWRDRGETPAETARRETRIKLAFGLDGPGWNEERALERYELMYEAGLPREAARNRGDETRGDAAFTSAVSGPAAFGAAMISDHRRILATAISRVRGKLKYRPIIFDLSPRTFTLSGVQSSVEALCGFSLHKPNFRRMISATGLIEETGNTTPETGGRPAALFRARSDVSGAARPALGLTLPRAGVIAER